MPDKLRILLLGDYSNCHNTLATGLRRLGCDVTVVSDGSKYLDTERNLDITRLLYKSYICLSPNNHLHNVSNM